MNFIPADESRIYIRFFDIYTKWTLKRRFRHLWLKQDYKPDNDSKTIYFLNHNYWWDGLIPLYLNERHFHQNARAIMEDKQMWQYSFFSKIGAFSIDLDNSRSIIRTLRYALDSMKRPSSSLFIYPEGTITHSTEGKPNFKEGLAWLYQRTENVDLVPIAIFIHHIRSSKPELYIHIGKNIEYDKTMSTSRLTDLFEEDIAELLSDVRKVAGFTDDGYTKQF